MFVDLWSAPEQTELERWGEGIFPSSEKNNGLLEAGCLRDPYPGVLRELPSWKGHGGQGPTRLSL